MFRDSPRFSLLGLSECLECKSIVDLVFFSSFTIPGVFSGLSSPFFEVDSCGSSRSISSTGNSTCKFKFLPIVKLPLLIPPVKDVPLIVLDFSNLCPFGSRTKIFTSHQMKPRLMTLFCFPFNSEITSLGTYCRFSPWTRSWFFFPLNPYYQNSFPHHTRFYTKCL